MRPYGQRLDNHRYVLNDNGKHAPASMHRAFKRAHRLEVRLEIERLTSCGWCKQCDGEECFYASGYDDYYDNWKFEPVEIVATPLIVQPFMEAFARAFVRSKAA